MIHQYPEKTEEKGNYFTCSERAFPVKRAGAIAWYRNMISLMIDQVLHSYTIYSNSNPRGSMSGNSSSADESLEVPILDLSAQHRQIESEMWDLISSIVDRNAYILGSELSSFEEAFASFCGVSHAVGVSSGTDALQLALHAAGVGPGDEVITVPHTFIATVEAIDALGATPVFVDIDEETYCMDPEGIEPALTEKTKAVLPVHIYGQPADMERIRSIVERYDLRVIEDASQAHGARWNGDRAGSLGDLGCFSFYPGKNMGALGDAGGVTTSDPKMAERLRSLRNHGQPAEKYRHVEMGYNARMDNLHAAVLELKLQHLDDWNASRREHARRYDRELGEEHGVTVPAVASAAQPVYHQYAVLVENRDEVKAKMSQRGISCGVHYPIPLHLQEACKDLGYEQGDFPVAEKVCSTVLTLPCFPEMTERQQDHVIRSLAEIVT